MNSQQNGSVRDNDPSVAATNKDLALRQWELLNDGDVDGCVSFFAEKVINHGFTVDREIVRYVLRDIRETSPDARFEPILVTAEGEWVTMRTRFTGTHLGVQKLPVNGGMLMGIAPTGKSFAVDHIHLFRFRDGKIHEHYACRDDLEMVRQLGLLPPAPSFDPGGGAPQVQPSAVTERVHVNAP